MLSSDPGGTVGSVATILLAYQPYRFSPLVTTPSRAGPNKGGSQKLGPTLGGLAISLAIAGCYDARRVAGVTLWADVARIWHRIVRVIAAS